MLPFRIQLAAAQGGRPARESSGYWQTYFVAVLAICVVGFGNIRAADVGASHPGSPGVTEVIDDMDAGTTSWTEAGGDAKFTLRAHDRMPQQGLRGSGCERFVIDALGGTSLYFSHPIEPAPIIDELRATVWVKSDRPGVQIMARVSFPRIIDPDTRRPATILVAGESSRKDDQWQELNLDDLPRRVQTQLPALRAKYGAEMDVNEATLDRILLNAFGGLGTTHLFIDDLSLVGAVPTTGNMLTAGEQSVLATPDEMPKRLPTHGEALPTGSPTIRLVGSVFEVNGQAFYPRFVEYHGEALSQLKALGVNGVRLTTVPDETFLREVNASGLWIVSPPPALEALAPRNGGIAQTRIDRRFDRVLAWDLGSMLSSAELTLTTDWARAVRKADPLKRPLFCDPESDLRGYSRTVDLLLLHREPLLTSFPLVECVKWLQDRVQLARPGTMFWTSVQTEAARSSLEQYTAITGHAPTTALIQDEQIRQLTLLSIAAGARGICFQSNHGLDQTDAPTRHRAKLLSLINLELDLIQPWLAESPSVNPASSSDPELAAVVLQLPRARLVVPYSIAPNSQNVLAAGTNNAVLLIPAGASAERVYELTPCGLRQLSSKRVAGGIKIALTPGDHSSLLVITQDPLVVSEITKRINAKRDIALRLARELAEENLQQAVGAMSKVVPAAEGKRDPKAVDPDKLMIAARDLLLESDRSAKLRDVSEAFSQQRRAGQQTLAAQRAAWQKAEKPFESPLASPLSSCFAALAEHQTLLAKWPAVAKMPNRLSGGDFEDLQQMKSAGWRQIQANQSDVSVLAEVSQAEAHSGHGSLHLQSLARAETPPKALELPAVWITSPDVDVQRGDWVLLHGFVKIPKEIGASADGLVILDSLTGEALATRFTATQGWREFGQLRVATESGRYNATFILTGLGDVWLDDVSVHILPAVSGSQLSKIPSLAPMQH